MGAAHPAADDALQDRLGHRFADAALLQQALTHRSFVHETGAADSTSYERLEFLGDSLLGMFVSDWLFRDDPRASEGVLSRRRQSVVRASTLAAAAAEAGLGERIRLGRGEDRTGGRAKSSLLADVFEALLGAVYLDAGVRAARAFVRRHLRGALEATRGASRTADDHKTRLQELAQARLQLTPRYRIVSTSGPDHALEFTAEVLVGDELWGRGVGRNRKHAEQQAARAALARRATEER